MTTIVRLFVAFHVRSFRYSSSGSNWRIVVNSDGADVVSALAHPPQPFEGNVVEFARGLPSEGYARAFLFGTAADGSLLTDSPPFDYVVATVSFDTALLNASSIRLETIGDDLLRLEHVVLWGMDAAGAVVPLAVASDLPNLSTDPHEGVSSIPLTLVDSGDDATPFTEMYAYVAITRITNSATTQPVSLRVERADGTLLTSSGLEDFSRLSSDGEHDARIWRFTEMTPARRVDALGPVVPKLRVDGPDNAMISAIVIFGVNRDAGRARVVPLVHHVPARAGTNPWVGTHTSPAGREMILPLCATAPRQ